MNRAEFEQNMLRLQSKFGVRSYDTEFTKLLWRDIQKYPDQAFRHTVDVIVGEHFKPLGIVAILEMVKQEAVRGGVGPSGAPRKGAIEFVECDFCDGYGLISLVDDRRYEFLYSCPICQNGANLRAFSGERLMPKATFGFLKGLRPKNQNILENYRKRGPRNE